MKRDGEESRVRGKCDCGRSQSDVMGEGFDLPLFKDGDEEHKLRNAGASRNWKRQGNGSYPRT